jgi:hypothetical protein
MVNKILTEAGIKYRRSRYTAKPLPDTYAVYFDEREAGGADGINCLITHNITVEVYESKPDDAAEAAIEAALDAHGLAWTCQDRYWLQEEQRYQVIYEFTYIEKRRITNG